MDPDNDAVLVGTDEGRSSIEDGLIVDAQGAVDVVHETSRSVDDQLASIHEAAGAQVEDMNSVADDVADLSATIQEVAAGADEVSETTERAATAAPGGRVAPDEAARAVPLTLRRPPGGSGTSSGPSASPPSPPSSPSVTRTLAGHGRASAAHGGKAGARCATAP